MLLQEDVQEMMEKKCKKILHPTPHQTSAFALDAKGEQPLYFATEKYDFLGFSSSAACFFPLSFPGCFRLAWHFLPLPARRGFVGDFQRFSGRQTTVPPIPLHPPPHEK